MSTTSLLAVASAPPRSAEALRLERITTAGELAALAPEWQRLWASTPSATPFQSPHWLLPWWKHIARGSLATRALRTADGELVGLAPLYVYTDAASGRRHLFPIGIATTDYLDPLVRPGWERPAWRRLMEDLAESCAEWDVLELPQLRWRPPLQPARGWRAELVPAEPNPVLPIAPGTTRLPLPRSMMQNIRTARSRAARAGRMTYELADPQTIPVFLDALEALHGRRWSQRGLPGVLADASVVACHRDAAPRLHEAGLLRLYALRLDGRIVAALYVLAGDAPHERRHYHYIGGFDPACAQLSPGTLLIAHAIEQAIAEGATAFDFLRGAEPYKYRWGAVDQPMWTLRARHGT
jgi:CelD/BcsL family acetyltransferase involved in cellulose biosynthesis